MHTICTNLPAAEYLHVEFNQSKGRHVIAKKVFKSGDIIISEDAHAAVSTCRGNNGYFHCNYCFKVLVGKGVSCHGCAKSIYCSETCKRSAWKSYHWFECCLGNALTEMCLESQMALRVLLRAAFMMFADGKSDCSSLHCIASDMRGALSSNNKENKNGCIKNCKTNTEEYESGYWSIYCLQTHQDEQRALYCADQVIKDVKYLTQVLLHCFAWHDKLAEEECALKCSELQCTLSDTEKTDELLSQLHSLFQKLCFSSYYSIEQFEIESWRHYMMSASTSRPDKGKADKERTHKAILTESPKSQQQILERLLLHHSLQLRTNAQAVFKVSDSTPNHKSPQITESIEQIRVATAFFPTISLMNHSCSPNTIVNFDGRSIKVVASKTINEGDEVCHCYGPIYTRYDLEERQKLLWEQYFFHCKCEICLAEASDDQELKSYKLQFHAFKCEHCHDPVKQVCNQDGNAEMIDGICINTECGKRQNLEKSFHIYNESKEIYEDCCNFVDEGRYENALPKFHICLKKRESVLFHNNIDIGKVHDQIAKCYINQEKYSSAIKHLCRSIAIVGMMYGPKSVEIAHEMQKLASTYYNLDDYTNAAKYAQKVISIFEKYFPGSSHTGVLEMRHILGICDMAKEFL